MVIMTAWIHYLNKSKCYNLVYCWIPDLRIWNTVPTKFIQQQFIATYLSCQHPAACVISFITLSLSGWHTPITTKADNKLYTHIQRQFHSHGVGNVQGRGCTIDKIILRKYIIYGCTLKGPNPPHHDGTAYPPRVSTRMHAIVRTTNIATSTVFDLLISCLRIERCNHQ